MRGEDDMKTKTHQAVIIGLFVLSATFVPFAAFAQSSPSVASTLFSGVTGVALSNPITAPIGIAAKVAGATVNSITATGQTTCNGLTDFWNNPTTCIARSASIYAGTGIIWIASWGLTLAGLLFNWVVTNTVLQFSSVVTANVVTAINTAWSAFRDISNIVIIGMFTFIAIATILGSVNYGAKKMISRVLIVAVLINFSLLFTKIIIDVSNFTAIQFFAAAANTPNCSQCSTLNQQTSSSVSTNSQSGASGATTGIAGAFLYYAGAQSFGDTRTALSKIAADPQNGGWYTLTYGVFIGILELVAAVVLLYGTFLLIARALLMIFLMVTSSIAFATYLLPSNWQGNFGWDAWWNALLKNAVFAPLLGILLWVTLTIAQAYNATASGSLGALVADPTQSSLNVAALFGYILVIGMLFVSIRIASSFASQIGGFNLAQAIAASPLTQGSRLGGFIGRRFVGNWAYGKEESRFGDAKKARDDAAEARRKGDFGAAKDFDKLAASNLRSAARYGKVAHSSLNLMNAGISKAVTKAIGLSGGAAGQSAKGAESAAAAIKRRADEAAKLGSKVAPSEDDKRRVREEAEKTITTLREGQKAEKEAIQKSAEQNAAAVKELADQEKSTNSEHQTAKANADSAERVGKDLAERHKAEVKNLTQQIEAEIGAGKDRARATLDTRNAQHKNEMAEQDNRIKEAREHLERVNQSIETKKFKIDTPNGPLETSLKEARARVEERKEDLKEFNKQTKSVIQNEVRKATNTLTESAAAITKEVAHTQGTILERTMGAFTGENHHVAEAAAHKYRSKNSNNGKISELIKEGAKEHGAPRAGDGAGGGVH